MESRIPANVEDNLRRLRSIVDRQYKQLEGFREQLTRCKEMEATREAELQTERDKGEDADGERIRGLEAICRKYRFDRRFFGDKIKELKGKIRWAEDRQLPFLESELVREQEDLTYKPFMTLVE